MSGRMPSQFFHMPNTETMEQEETYFQLFSRLVAIPTKTCCISYFSPLGTKKVENTFFGGWSVLPQAWGNNYRRTKIELFMLALHVNETTCSFFPSSRIKQNTSMGIRAHLFFGFDMLTTKDVCALRFAEAQVFQGWNIRFTSCGILCAKLLDKHVCLVW